MDSSTDRSLRRILASGALAAPASTGLLLPDGRTWSFAELNDAANELAGRLPQNGGRIAIRLGNDVNSVVAVHAVWKAGATIVAVSRLLPDIEADRRIAEVGACAVVRTDGDSITAATCDPGSQPGANTADEALIMFTSGTTGRSKAAALTFAALQASVTGIAVGSGLPPSGREPRTPARGPQVTFVPLAHMGGFLSLLASWWLGKPLLLCEKFSTALAFEVAGRFRLGVLRLTPTMVYELANAEGEATLPGIDSVSVGTAPLAEATRHAFESRFSVPVLRNYGQTEFAGAIAFERLDDVHAGRRPDGTVGRLAPGVEVRIVSSDGTVLAPDEVGEIQARSASAMTGYLDEAKPSIVAPQERGWIATGDLGQLDGDGFLHVVGRVRDLILCGGFNVYPTQLESALSDLPEIIDAAVAGLPDERLGEIPVAAVVARGDATVTLDGVRAALRKTLAPYELPRRLVTVLQVPRNEMGKIDRPGVLALFESNVASA